MIHRPFWGGVVPRSRFVPLGALLVLSLIWGYNWVVMKVAIADCPPLLFAALRVLGGALALLPVLGVARRPLAMPPLSYLVPLGLLQSTAFVGLALWALQYAGAGPTAVLVYMMPIWLTLLAWPFLGEPVRGRQWAALGLAGAGVLAIVAPWAPRHAPVVGTVLALLAGLAWAVSALWQKRRAPPGFDLWVVTFWQMTLGGMALAVIAILVEPWHIHWTAGFIAALVYNAVPGTALALVLWAYAVDNLPTGIAGMATLVTPLIGALAAWWQLGERPSGTEVGGMVAILMSLALLVSAQWLA